MRTDGQWKAIGGADDGVQRYALIGFDGPVVHGWVQSVRPGQPPGMGYASANLGDLEAELRAAAGAVSGADVGLFGIGKALKKLAKKTGITKVVKKASRLADYALSNPLVKGALAATGPMGMSVIAAHQGYKMLKGYAKRNPKAMRFVKGVVNAAKMGNPRAIKMQRMLRLGQRAFGTGAINRYAVRRPGTPPRYGTRRWGSRYRPLCPRGRVSGDLEAMAGADAAELGKWLGGAGVAYMGEHEIEDIALSGADQDAEIDEAIADLKEFTASSGAWEGMALLGEDVGIGAWEGLGWMAKRLAPRSMAAHPNEMTARDALLDGRQGQAARFA